ncbi:hypothetical protein GN244_ATG09130 [Phytophthora infestans]|uniref:Uncharacterized protein n=1 Tax=Phytophthora infestans TaxID=4787 RepID=A0A833WE07_PHYIN|nr:hypothetical protein GN244_ATG09130 [Phytophthora infestans]
METITATRAEARSLALMAPPRRENYEGGVDADASVPCSTTGSEAGGVYSSVSGSADISLPCSTKGSAGSDTDSSSSGSLDGSMVGSESGSVDANKHNRQRG